MLDPPDGAAVTFLPYGSPDGAHLSDGQTVALYESELQELTAVPRSRVLVGRRGSGKTALVKRAIKQLGSPDSQVVAVADITLAPAIDDLLAIERGVEMAARIERWADAWRASFLRSFCTRVMCDPQLSHFDSARLQEVDGYWHLLGESSQPTTPMGACAELGSIAMHTDNLVAYLRDARWSGLERALAELISERGPVMIVLDLDAVTMPAAPGEWMRSQWGLIVAIQRLAAGPLARWLSLVATMREENVVSYAARHPSMLLRNLLLTLETDRASIEQYVDDLLLLVEDGANDRSVGPSPSTHVLRNFVVRNRDRSIDEKCLDYMLRHTRYVPRDFVAIANDLAKRLSKTGPPTDDGEAVRRAVRTQARDIGLEQLATCAGFLTALMSPEDTMTIQLRHGEPGQTTQEMLNAALRAVGTDRFSAKDLERWSVDHNGLFAERLPDALWRAGLLGVVSQTGPAGHTEFFSLLNSEPVLPEGDRYAFHPTLLDALRLTHADAVDPPTIPVIEGP